MIEKLLFKIVKFNKKVELINSGKFILISLYSIFKGLFINDVVLIIKKILVILEFIILLKIILEEFW